MESGEFCEARENLEALIKDYEESCCVSDSRDDSYVSEIE